MGGILGYGGMKEALLLKSGEIAFIEKEKNRLHNIGTTLYYAGIAGNDASDPLRMQYVPSEKELEFRGYEKPDPLCEKQFASSDRIIHRYHDRVLFLATGRCALYCRHCFRRYLGERGIGDAGEEDVESLVRYISDNTQVREVLISGGDPLMLDNEFLEYMCTRIRTAGKDIAIRIGTRVPVVNPSRVDMKLASALAKYSPLYLFTQFNHAREVTPSSSHAVSCFVKSGIPVLNQSVLLKGINNTEADLEKLFYSLISISVKPYYLFQGDLASGTSHFRTPLLQGIEIMEKLRKKMSALSLPMLAVDLPDGGGKALLDRGSVIKREGGFFYIRSNEGKIFAYPDEE